MPEQSYIWEEENRYFNVITVPVFVGYNLLGTLSYGLPIRHQEAIQLSDDVGMDVIFFVNDRIIAESFGTLSSSDQGIISQSMFEASYAVLTSNQASTSEISLNEETWLIYLAPMFDNYQGFEGIKGYYGVAKSLDLALGPYITYNC